MTISELQKFSQEDLNKKVQDICRILETDINSKIQINNMFGD